MTTVIIPARLASKRLPRKLLLDRTGRPLLWHAVENALCSSAQRVVVASEDDAILDAIGPLAAGRVSCVKTPICSSGTERVAWVVREEGIRGSIVNLQGDEPELSGQLIDRLIAARHDSIDVVTLTVPCTSQQLYSPSVVKVVVDHNKCAMYFSRSPIPYGDDGCRHHVGVYVYDANFLLSLRDMPPTSLPGEMLEQLQWLQCGHKIKVLSADDVGVGIDTADEYHAFVHRWRARHDA